MDSFELSEDDAKTVALALSYYNNYLAEECNRILADSSSDFIKQAALQNYQSATEAGTNLHVRLAKHFPALSQGHVQAG